MAILKKNKKLIILALLVLLIVLYGKDLYAGIVEGMKSYKNQVP